MAARVCPHCNWKLSGTQIVAYSDAMECPNCHTILEVANGSRYIATTLGFIAAVCVYRFERGIGGPGGGQLLGAVLPIVYAYFTLSVISPLVLMSVAELQKAPPAPQPIASSGGGHDAGHH